MNPTGIVFAYAIGTLDNGTKQMCIMANHGNHTDVFWFDEINAKQLVANLQSLLDILYPPDGGRKVDELKPRRGRKRK